MSTSAKEKEKEKKKIKTSNINELMGGFEPNWESDPKPLPFIRGLNWYSNQKSYKDSKAYLVQYLKEQKYSKSDISKINNVPDNIINNIGFVCRMRSRGYSLEPSQIILIEEKIKYFLSYTDNKEDKFTSSVTINPQPQDEPQTKELGIQDRILAQSVNYINEIEGIVDDLLKKKPINFKPYDYFIAASVKNVHVKHIVNHYTPMLTEMKTALSGKDPDLKEAYSLLKKAELKNICEFLETVISDANSIASNSKITRKPKAKKIIPAEKKVSKLIYKKEDVPFKLVSIKPTEIISCKQLWVFNTKTKKLGVYESKDESGLSVKGSTLENFNEVTSISKTLRKPNEILPTVLKGTKTSLKKIMPQISSVENKLNGRINSDTILLKVIK